MKVIKEKKEKRGVTLRLNESVMAKIDRIAKDQKVSRQRLIEAVLEQAIADPSFVVRVK